MVAPRHRTLLLRRFAALPEVTAAADDDTAILAVEQRLREQRCAVGLYEEPLMRIWKEPASRVWDEAVWWCGRIVGRSDFAADELAYKRAIAAELSTVRERLASAPEQAVTSLQEVLRRGDNNLVAWQARDRFARWCADAAPQAAVALTALWRPATALDQRIGDFLAALPEEAAAGPGTRLSIASLLLGADGLDAHPLYRWQVERDLRRLLGMPDEQGAALDPEAVHRPEELAARIGVDGGTVRAYLRETYPREAEAQGERWHLTAAQAEQVLAELGPDDKPSSAGATYLRWCQLLTELRLRLIAAGHDVPDMVTAQSAAWWLVHGAPPEEWSDSDKSALDAFRHGPAEHGSTAAAPRTDGDSGAVPVGDAAPTADFPDPTDALASDLSLPSMWLQGIVEELRRKRQLILHGPPGTGKTFVALKLGELVEAAGGRCELVQFHPSYGYEDFFEGYRPFARPDGTLAFELVPGVLRELADAAAARPDLPHLLVIDEVNRGNIAKIFGELYFLLEYRDREIRLQYSQGRRFRLPPNLFFIGTMNTMDRSIALFDMAMRRRFSFVELDPAREPVAPLLERWLQQRGLDLEPAVLLRQLNAALAPDGLAFGHSHFISRDGRKPDLEQVWEREILPLLEDHFHGSGRAVRRDFDLFAIRRLAAAAADAAGGADDDDDLA